MPLVRRPVPSALLSVAVLAALLGGCGSQQEAPAVPAKPTDAELTTWMGSADADAKSIGQAVAAKYKADRAFPASADGLGTLSEGNRVGQYEQTAQSVVVCVEHVRDGMAWVANSYYVGTDGRVNPQSKVKNGGCV